MAIRGAPAVERQLRSWFRDPGTFEELRRWLASLLAEMADASHAG
jgi:hypothetical protein